VAKTTKAAEIDDDEVAPDVEAEAAESADDAEEAPARMELKVSIDKSGPCKRHVRVVVPRDAIEQVASTSVEELMDSAAVPGFRVGHVPEQLIRKRFKKELSDQVKQKVLVQSLEQLSEDEKLEPINVPNLDPEAFEIPDEGDFEYEFDVEVRPEFELPKYKGLKIERPVREITDADVDNYVQELREQHGQLEPIDEPASAGDFVTVDLAFTHNGQPLRKLEELSVRIRPVLRFQDGELTGFDKLMKGAKPDDVREADLAVSLEADNVAMRGETVQAAFTVLDVKRLSVPELNEEFLSRIGVDSEEDLRQRVRERLERQVTYQQRQATRQQVLAKITESADWDLPEDLVRKQVDNALRREVLEMQQAGFSPREIRAKENDLRQHSITMTRKNLKEHFVLDRIAEEEKIEVTPQDVDVEISLMALQSGENPRRVRARLQKSGVIENLEAQIRERKAVDIILEHADFKDKKQPATSTPDVEAVDRSICSTIADTEVEDEEESGEE
jgi:trigger factor